MVSPSGGAVPLPPDDAAAWGAVRAVRQGAVVPASLENHPLCRMMLPVARPETLVLAQLGQSLDGRIATIGGGSALINGPCGLDHLHRLRALADAVLVGVGTVCADDCQLTVRRVEGPSPARVVIDPRGRMPPLPRALRDDGVRRIVIRAEGAPHCAEPGVETVHLRSRGGLIAPADIVAALARRGLRRLLIEGGAATVSAFMSGGALDRLHVVVAPLIVGSGQPGLSLPPICDLDRAARPVTIVHPLADGDVLFDCDMRASAGARCDGGRDERDASPGRLFADG